MWDCKTEIGRVGAMSRVGGWFSGMDLLDGTSSVLFPFPLFLAFTSKRDDTNLIFIRKPLPEQRGHNFVQKIQYLHSLPKFLQVSFHLCATAQSTLVSVRLFRCRTVSGYHVCYVEKFRSANLLRMI